MIYYWDKRNGNHLEHVEEILGARDMKWIFFLIVTTSALEVTVV